MGEARLKIVSPQRRGDAEKMRGVFTALRLRASAVKIILRERGIDALAS